MVQIPQILTTFALIAVRLAGTVYAAGGEAASIADFTNISLAVSGWYTVLDTPNVGRDEKATALWKITAETERAVTDLYASPPVHWLSWEFAAQLVQTLEDVKDVFQPSRFPGHDLCPDLQAFWHSVERLEDAITKKFPWAPQDKAGFAAAWGATGC
ncbi:hypothetical protein DFH06DRAFT_1466730 [Mycena polygramma]|nr:hypothetical protein DFH06DRAFT_1466730 [Mycena polygramma]